VLYTENFILTPSRVLSSKMFRDFVPENSSLNTVLKLSEITNNRIPEQINTRKYIKSFNELVQDAKNLKELSELYNNTNIFVHSNHHFSVVYITEILILAISLYNILIKYKCKLPRLYRPEIAESQNVEEYVQPIHYTIAFQNFRKIRIG